MSNVIDFLERWGQDAQLRHATSAELAQALAAAQVDSFARKALVSGDRRHLEFLLGTKPTVCSLIFIPSEEELPKKAGEEKKEKAA